MKRNLISRLNFLKLSMASLASLPFISVAARTDQKRPPVNPGSAPRTRVKVTERYPQYKGHMEHTPYHHWRMDEESGVRIKQLTSSPKMHHHIYPEAPIFTPDSRFFVYTRRDAPDEPISYWLCEMDRWYLRRLTSETPVRGPVIAPDGDYFYYLWEKEPHKSILIRKNLWSGEREELIEADGVYDSYWLSIITPDGRYYCTSFVDNDGMAHIARFDLTDRSWKIIFSRPDIHNSHLQIEPGEGTDLLIQQNRGGRLDKQLSKARTGPDGTTLFLIDINGESYRPLPVGKPHTPDLQGHQCWVGKTGKILTTINGDRIVDEWRNYRLNYEIEIDGKKGNLICISEKRDKVSVVAGGQYFDHIVCTPDGKYFISDDLDGNIWMGLVRTGRYRRLCRSGSTIGGYQFTSEHPFFSPDGRYAFFNSTADGGYHIYVAAIPEEFLKSLET
ncbi:MAG: hypothetical protein ABFS38_06065 [Bacteroidota bacterium]